MIVFSFNLDTEFAIFFNDFLQFRICQDGHTTCVQGLNERFLDTSASIAGTMRSIISITVTFEPKVMVTSSIPDNPTTDDDKAFWYFVHFKDVVTSHNRDDSYQER